jgi:hypothetical protein
MQKSQTPAGKISIGLQLGGALLETRNLSLGYLRFFRLALLPVLGPFYLSSTLGSGELKAQNIFLTNEFKC